MELGTRTTFALTEEAHSRLKETAKGFGLNQFETLSIILEHFELNEAIEGRAQAERDEKLKERESKKALRAKLRNMDPKDLEKLLEQAGHADGK